MGDTVSTVETRSTTDGGRAGGPRPQWKWIAALAVVVAVVASLVVVLVNRNGGGETTTQASTTSTQPATSATSEPSTTAAGAAPAPPASQASAADVLERFFSAAATMDGQLESAAAAINAAGPPWEAVGEEVASTVRAADIEVVEGTIPAGLPTDLLRSVTLVYSDLSSRRAAMQSFSYTRAPGEPVNGDLLAELRNGHAAAERFDGDMAAARSLAASLPPVTVAPSDSRAAAELLLIIQDVHKANWGCNSRGGAVFTDLPHIEWLTDTSGTIGGPPVATEFTAILGPDGQWQVNILAC